MLNPLDISNYQPANKRLPNSDRDSFKLTWIVVLLALIATQSFGTELPAQQPDTSGWSSDPSPIQPAFDLNSRPERLLPLPNQSDFYSTNSANASGPTSLSDNVRSQIGLTSFEELVAPTADNANATPGSNPNQNAETTLSDLFSSQTEQLTSRDGLGSSIKVALLLATLSLAPAIILMTTCYIRVIVVLTLLKQAFGAQQLPPTQVLTALSMFITLLVMTPVWNEVKTEAIDPYTQAENGISWEEAWERGIVPIKRFMGRQIEVANNGESIALFYKYLPDQPSVLPTSVQEVPINVLLPAFVISELKVAFLLGFQIFLPFLVLDLVVSSVTVSTGMLMLPPTMVSFPLKLILFVMVDGWNLVVGMLLQSFAPFT